MKEILRIVHFGETIDFDTNEIILLMEDQCFAIYRKNEQGFAGTLLFLIRSFPDEIFLGDKEAIEILCENIQLYTKNGRPWIENSPLCPTLKCFKRLSCGHLFTSETVNEKLYQGRIQHFWPN